MRWNLLRSAFEIFFLSIWLRRVSDVFNRVNCAGFWFLFRRWCIYKKNCCKGWRLCWSKISHIFNWLYLCLEVLILAFSPPLLFFFFRLKKQFIEDLFFFSFSVRKKIFFTIYLYYIGSHLAISCDRFVMGNYMWMVMFKMKNLLQSHLLMKWNQW